MIFISYRISDANQFVARLDDSLSQEFGDDAVFRDKTRIDGGQQWPVEIEQNANARPIMLVVMGKAWESATCSQGKHKGYPRLHDPEDWVRKEITIALTTNKTVIPIFVDGAEMPDKVWLANFGLDDLADKQGIPVRTDDYNTDFPKLVGLLRGTCAGIPQCERASAEDDKIRAAERRWQYIQNHPIRGIEILLLLKVAVGFNWFSKILDDTRLTFSRDQSFKLSQFLATSPAPNTKERSRALDNPVCSYWEIYKHEPGYWFRKITRASREFSVVAGFDAEVPWSILGVQRVVNLEDLALMTEIGVSIPARAYQAGVEEFTITFLGDTFSFSVKLSEQGLLGALHEFARTQHTVSEKEDMMPIGTSFGGVQLLDMFFRQLRPRSRTETPKPFFGVLGMAGPNGNAISFYPNLPTGFNELPESNEYVFTITVPSKIDSPAHIKSLEEKLESNPADTESYVKLASLFSYEGRIQDAINCLRTAIDCAPVSDDVHGLMGEALAKLGRFEEAFSHFQTALALAPDKAAAQVGLGFCLHELGKDDIALAHFEAAASMEPSNADFQANLRKALTNLRRYSEALIPAQRAVDLAPDDAENAMLLGILLDMDGRAEEATPFFEKATQLAPTSANAHEFLGQHLAKANLHEKAVASFQHAIDIEEDMRRCVLLGASFANLDRWSEAEVAFRRGLELDPKNPGILANLGATVANLGRLAEAVELLDQSLRIDPNNVAVKHNLALLRDQ